MCLDHQMSKTVVSDLPASILHLTVNFNMILGANYLPPMTLVEEI